MMQAWKTKAKVVFKFKPKRSETAMCNHEKVPLELKLWCDTLRSRVYREIYSRSIQYRCYRMRFWDNTPKLAKVAMCMIKKSNLCVRKSDKKNSGFVICNKEDLKKSLTTRNAP